MVNVKDVKLGKNTRKSFAKINEVLEMPTLLKCRRTLISGSSMKV